MLTKKEHAELKRLNRKLFGGKGTRKEVLRALELKRKQPVSVTPNRNV